MKIIKTILAVLAIFIAITGIILCAAGIVYSWTLNTPITNRLVRTVEAAERVLTVTSEGLDRVDGSLVEARSAVSTIDGAVRAVGETIVETDIAFEILDRTVGDTLFPKIVSAYETTRALAGTVLAINSTLEAANEIPFIEVPTLTGEIEAAEATLAEAQGQVNEIRTEIKEIKASAVGRPVEFVTTRTGALITGMDQASGSINTAQTQVNRSLALATQTRLNLPGVIDLVSIVVTLVLAWLIVTQLCVLIRSWRYLSQAK